MMRNVCWSLVLVVVGIGLAPPAPTQMARPTGRAGKVIDDGNPAPRSSPRPEYDPCGVLVRFEAGTSEEMKALARTLVGGTLLRSFRNVPGLEQLRISIAVGEGVSVLRMLPGVDFAEPDCVVRASDAGGASISQAPADNAGSDPRIVVGVLDTGVNFVIPPTTTSPPTTASTPLTTGVAAPADNAWTNAGEIPGNGIDDDHNGYVDDVHGYDFRNNDADPMDDSGHGTRSAGALVDQDGRRKIMAVKVLDAEGKGLISDAVAALDYAVTMGAGVVSCDWSVGSSSAAWSAAVDSAREKGARVKGASVDRPGDGAGAPGAGRSPVLGAMGSSVVGPGGARAVDGPVGGRGGVMRLTPWPTRGGRGLRDRNTDGGPQDANEGILSHDSAQDLDISLGPVSDPVEQFIPSIATWRYIQAAIDSHGEGRGIQVVDASPHDGKVADGNDSVWFGVDFIADRTDQEQYIGGEISAAEGCLAYIDPGASPAEADLCFAVIVGSRYSVCRLPGVVRPGVRVSFQACCRLHQGDWQVNPFHGAPSAGDPARVTRASVPALGASLSAFVDSEISIMHHGGSIPGVMAAAPDLLAGGAQASFFAHGSFTGKLFAFEYHPTTFTSTVADFPQPTRAKVSFTFRGVSQDPVILTNRGTAREVPGALLSGPRSNQISTGVWLPPSRDALSGDLAAVGTWLQKLGAGERCVAIVIGDSNCAAAEGGLTDALIQAVMTYYGGQGYDARPDVYWSATMSDNHPLRQYAGLGGRISYGGDVSASPDDIPLVNGAGPALTYPFPAPQAPFTSYEWAAYAGSAMHAHRPGTDSDGLLSAFCTSDTSDTARWRLPNIYGVQNTADGAMNDPRNGHARLAGNGLLYARSRIKAGDLVCLEAVLGQRVANPGGSVQFALRAQDGADTPLANGGRLVSASGGLSGPGWMTVDAIANGVDAQRESLAAAYTGQPGQPMRPASMDVWSPQTAPLSGVGRRGFTRVRSQAWVVGETAVPGAGIAIAPVPVSYQPYVLLRRRTICSMFGVRIIGNLNPGQDHPRLAWTVAMLGIGGTRAVDQMSWLYSDPAKRVLREAYWRNVLDGLNAGGAHVLFVHVESQNSAGQPTGVPADALDDRSSTWAGYTGAKIRALHTLARRAGAASVCTIAVNSPRLTSDSALARGDVLRGIAPLLDHCAAIDLYRVIGQRETMDSFWALNPYLVDVGYDTAHPHYTLLGTAAIGSALATGLQAAGGR
jgi:hypothetical protein